MTGSLYSPPTSEEALVKQRETVSVSTPTTSNPQRAPPLVFITHSLGSYVTRHMLTHYNDPSASIFDTAEYSPKIINILEPFSLEEKSILEERQKDNRLGELIQKKFTVWIHGDQVDEDNGQKLGWRRGQKLIQTIYSKSRWPQAKLIGNETSLSISQRIQDAIQEVINYPKTTENLNPAKPDISRGAEHRVNPRSSSAANIVTSFHRYNFEPQQTHQALAVDSNKQWDGSHYSLIIESVVSDDELFSDVWHPAAIVRNAPHDKLNRTIELGRSFFHDGDLKGAERAFIRCKEMVEPLQLRRDHRHRHLERYEIRIRALLASIKLYSGDYKGAMVEFDAVLRATIIGFSSYERDVVKRWIAISLLYNGQYELAAKNFSVLLHKIQHRVPRTITAKISIRTHLALALASQGDYPGALEQVAAARDDLRCSQITVRLPDQSGESTRASATPSLNGNSGKHEIDASKTLELAKRNELLSVGDYIDFTESRILFMYGNFEGSIKLSGKSFDAMKKRWGATHFRTLECASHHSIVLTYNSRITDAEGACITALARTESGLGSHHPQTMETMSHLVKIYLFQARLDEAGDTAKSLAKDTELSMTAEHPQTHNSRYLVTETLLARGYYTSAEFELESVIESSSAFHRIHIPDILHYQSTLALIKYLSGKLQEAENMAIRVLY
ncbi:hypothetical protein F4808DRAFT_35101 [Astrocystis sublimbata]|nr:hypothetical protein F4808DRAFT_35101 [Astrocystis sublimbata]